MGICVHVIDSRLRISKQGLQKAARKLRFDDARELDEALRDNGWILIYDKKGNVTQVDFDGDKLHGDMDELLPKLAPFVKARSFIQFEGEAFVRYEFDGKRCLLRYSDEMVEGPEDVEPEVLFGSDLEPPEGVDEDEWYLGEEDRDESDDELCF